MSKPDWWKKPRNISIVVDNDSWILPYAQQLYEWCNRLDDNAKLCRTHDEVMEGGVAFYLGCIWIAPPALLQLNHRNLVVHASDLPKGRGMSPWTWQVLEGVDSFPLCLLEAQDEVDSGDIIYKEWISLNGSELVNELRHLIGEKTVKLCQKYLAESEPVCGKKQEGEPSYYRRRKADDSQLDPNKTIEEQFNLLRVVDNDKYPAFFEYRGQKYILKIKKDASES